MALTKISGSILKDPLNLGEVSIGGTLTYQDVTNVDALGIGTFRTGINVSGGQLDVGSNIKIGNAGVKTATSFVGSGANLTNLPAQATIANNGNDRIITGGSGVNLNGEANLQFDGFNLFVSDKIKHLGDPDTLIEFATDTITLDTAGTERLRIDSSGNVTKPTNFHLLVNLSQNYTVQNASTTNTDLVKWDRVITAQSSSGASSYFNTSTHLFTAPVDGIYLFHIAVNCDFNVEGAWLVIDGSRANYSAVGPRSSTQSSISLTYKLTASQTVGVKWYDAGNTNADFFSNDLHTWWKIT